MSRLLAFKEEVYLKRGLHSNILVMALCVMPFVTRATHIVLSSVMMMFPILDTTYALQMFQREGIGRKKKKNIMKNSRKRETMLGRLPRHTKFQTLSHTDTQDLHKGSNDDGGDEAVLVSSDDESSSKVRAAGVSGNTEAERGGPSNHMNLNIDARPIDYFNLMITEEFRDKVMVGCTNMKAAMEGAGNKQGKKRTNYPDFTPFDREEIDAFLGLILANGIHLKP